MSERTEYSHGTPSWADLSTDSVEAAKTFYGEIFGWEFEDMPTGEPEGEDSEQDSMMYSMASLQNASVAAVFEGDGSLPVHWNSYVTVDDLDAMPDRVKDAGGEVLADPFDVLDSGRMSTIKDPSGAFLNLWEPKKHVGAGLANEPGALTWFELNTTDVDGVKAFYETLFGWSFEEAPESDGDYWIAKNGDRPVGGIRKLADDQIPSHWLPYFASEDAAKHAALAGEHGGTLFFGPVEVPNGAYAILQDPQGGAFGLYSGDFGD